MYITFLKKYVLIIAIVTLITINMSNSICSKGILDKTIDKKNIKSEYLMPTYYNITGPGRFRAIGVGYLNPTTGEYNYSYGVLRFQSYFGGGPNTLHKNPPFTWTYGMYTPTEFIGINNQFGNYVVIVGYLKNTGYITGISYP